MKRLPVVYSDQALRDLEFIFAAVLDMSGSIVTATRYAERIEARCFRIGDVPNGGAPRPAIVEGLRIVPFEKRAVITYVVEGEAVLITNVFYGGEDYEAILGGRRSDHRTS